MLKKVFYMAAAGFTAFCVAASLFIDDTREEWLSGQQPAPQSKEGRPAIERDQLEALKKALLKVGEETAADNRQAHRNAVLRFQENTQQSRQRSMAAIDNVISELISFPASASLLALAVKDLAYGTSEVDSKIINVLDKHILRNMVVCLEQVDAELMTMEGDLERNSTNLAVTVASLSEKASVPESKEPYRAFQAFTRGADSVHGIATAHLSGVVVSSVGLGLSAVMINSTIEMIKKVMGAILKRLGVITAVALSAAAADGPFPVGDAIAVLIEIGATGWCMYDLYNVHEESRDEISSVMAETINRIHDEILQGARLRADRLVAGFNEAATRTVNTIIETL